MATEYLPFLISFKPHFLQVRVYAILQFNRKKSRLETAIEIDKYKL